MFKQIIITRKDLDMSPGKLAAQVSHGSMAFLTSEIRRNSYPSGLSGIPTTLNNADAYYCTLKFDVNLYTQWLNESFTKAVLSARNKNHLLKAITMAEELGLVEGQDFFLIYDACRTEIEPEEDDGSTLTVIGFAPFDSDFIDKIGKKYQLYK